MKRQNVVSFFGLAVAQIQKAGKSLRSKAKRFVIRGQLGPVSVCEYSLVENFGRECALPSWEESK